VQGRELSQSEFTKQTIETAAEKKNSIDQSDRLTQTCHLSLSRRFEAPAERSDMESGRAGPSNIDEEQKVEYVYIGMQK